MPLVQIKVNTVLFPSGDASLLNHQQRAVVELAKELPVVIAANADAFCLPPNAPSEVTQVELAQFGDYDVNVPDVWVFMLQTEELPVERRIAQRDLMKYHLGAWRTRLGLNISVALDIFFGPGHGWLALRDVPEHTW